MINIKLLEVTGWYSAIHGMRNPMNSWDRSDTFCGYFGVDIGDADYDLMLRLAKGGPTHAKYRRMVKVYFDIVAPLYWWKEMDTYAIGKNQNSCSTMHKIHDRDFTMDDFSQEHLLMIGSYFENDTNSPVVSDGEDTLSPTGLMFKILEMLNQCRRLYLKTGDKVYWWQIIQLLPSSYNQKRTVELNYENLSKIYHERKNHKLDEWRVFCDFIESLPHSKIITCKKENYDDCE